MTCKDCYWASAKNTNEVYCKCINVSDTYVPLRDAGKPACKYFRSKDCKKIEL